MRRLLTGVVVSALLTATLTVGTAHAHTGLNRADPGPGDTSQAGLDRIEMEFNGRLEPSAPPQIKVLDQQGTNQVTADPAVVDNRMTVHLRPLNAGLYMIQYTVTFEDKHASSGGYYLNVVPGPDDGLGGSTWLYALGGVGGAVLLLLLLVGLLRRRLRKS